MSFTPDNSLTKKTQTKLQQATPANIRGAMANAAMQNQLKAMISDPKRRDSMVSSMVGMVQQTAGLQECELGSVYNAAIAGEALKLPYGFGYWYAVPRANNSKGRELGFPKGEYKEAIFQMGYKGFVQLAMRAGEYKDMDVFEVKEGELKNPIKRTKMLDDFIYLENHDELETIGYYAFFILHNGFTKGIYLTRKTIVKHAAEYSYFKDEIHKKLLKGEKIIVKRNNKTIDETWKYSSNWYKNFDMMAEKTVLKRLLSKWGILSVEMQSAMKSDQAVVNEKGEPVAYPDNPKNPANKEDVIEAEITEEPKPEKQGKDVSNMFKKDVQKK